MSALKAGGYSGKILRVDLSTGHTSEESLDDATLRKYVGGTGLGAKILYEEVPPGVEWKDPENRLIMATGPLAGTRASGGGTFSVVTKGAITNGATSTQANGYLGAYLKFCGFDGIVFQGTARDWVYLHIQEGRAQIKDAHHLLGKDTWETEEAIKAEMGKGEREMSVFGIGPAGENLVRFAAICGDKGHVAAHNGVGAVMGSKKLKAVAVERGKRSIAVKDGARLTTLMRQVQADMEKDPALKRRLEWGTSALFSGAAVGGWLPVRNLTTNLFPEHEKYMGAYYRPRMEMKYTPCWACRQRHCHIVRVKEGPYAGYVAEEPEYEGWAAWVSLIDQRDHGAAVMLNDVTDRLGMDVNEAGWLMGLLMECYEKGVITKKDTDGIDMTWGNAEAVRQMLHKVARREGCGDILAEGVTRAAARIGGEAPDFAVHVMKGAVPRGHDHRARWAELFDTAVSNTGTIETGNVPVSDNFNPLMVSSEVARKKGEMPFEDCLGTCRFWSWNNLNHYPGVLTAVTGWDFDMKEALEVGLRAVNLLRAFNIRHGIGPESEVPSPRYGSAPVDGPCQGKSIMPHWGQMMDNYYRLMGWDRQTGKPWPETLRRLGLEHIIADLWVEEPTPSITKL